MRFVLLFVAFHLALDSIGQQDSIVLKDIVIEAKSIETISNYYENLKGDRFTNNASNWLQTKSTVYIKQYGNNLLATPSVHGLGGAHTQVKWNGLQLNSAMNGLVDLSLLPISLFQNIQLNKSNATYAGGNLTYQNELPDSNGLYVNMGFTQGSFGLNAQNFSLAYKKNKVAGQLFFNHQAAMNNFKYKDAYSLHKTPKENKHAVQENYDLLFNQIFQLNKQHSLQLNFWYQSYQRQIPPTVAELTSAAEQADENYRASLLYSFRKGNTEVSALNGFTHEQNNYRDEASLLNSQNELYSWQANFNFRQKIGKKEELSLNFSNQMSRANASTYEALQNKAVLDVESLSDVYKHKLFINLSLSPALLNEKLLPFAASFRLSYKQRQERVFYVMFSRNYRNPTLNDLYWQPGGNKNLKNEILYAAHLGLNNQQAFKQSVWSVASNTYINYVSNWIVWVPQNTFWQAENLRKVMNAGTEAELDAAYHFSHFDFMANAKYVFNYSRILASHLANDASVGKELIYAPKHKVILQTGFTYKGFRFSPNYTYIDQVFTLLDNSERLAAVHLIDLELDKTFMVQKFIASVGISMNNLLNHNYEIVAGRPMPGIHYAIHLKFNFHDAI